MTNETRVLFKTFDAKEVAYNQATPIDVEVDQNGEFYAQPTAGAEIRNAYRLGDLRQQLAAFFHNKALREAEADDKPPALSFGPLWFVGVRHDQTGSRTFFGNVTGWSAGHEKQSGPRVKHGTAKAVTINSKNVRPYSVRIFRNAEAAKVYADAIDARVAAIKAEEEAKETGNEVNFRHWKQLTKTDAVERAENLKTWFEKE